MIFVSPFVNYFCMADLSSQQPLRTLDYKVIQNFSTFLFIKFINRFLPLSEEPQSSFLSKYFVKAQPCTFSPGTLLVHFTTSCCITYKKALKPNMLCWQVALFTLQTSICLEKVISRIKVENYIVCKIFFSSKYLQIWRKEFHKNKRLNVMHN